MKKLLILLTLSITILSGCAQITKNSDVEVSPNESTPSESITLTLEELAQYNGQDSQLAYVAVNGIIYDVSAIPQWLNGMHKNGLTAGQDLSDYINSAPHGQSVLTKLPIIGNLVE